MESLEFILFRVALFVYIATWVVSLICLLFKKTKLTLPVTILLGIGLAVNIASIVTRGLATGYMPFSNIYETMSIFSAFLAAAFLVSKRWIKTEFIGTYGMPIVLAAMIIGVAQYTEAGMLPPALRSIWLSIHVPIAILSYSMFALAFIGGILYLLKERAKDGMGVTANISLATLDNFGYRIITIGFILLTLAIITGAVWAEIAWGTYWSWDPKETWSLVTWIVYAAYLHSRLLRGWQGKRSAILAIVGFLAVIFTYFGVNLLGGLHAYA